MTPLVMSNLADIRRERDERRLNCAIYQADLHATGEESVELVQLKHAVRAGLVDYEAAIGAVNALRDRQKQAV